MKLLKMPEPQCLLYSAAMVLDLDPEELIQEIGFTGLEVFWPELEKPYCYRGIHPQEIQDCCLVRNRCFVILEADSASGPHGGHPKKIRTEQQSLARIQAYLTGNTGILIGVNRLGNPHACAWDGSQVYDPNGQIYSIMHFSLQEFWMIKIILE